MKKFNADGGSRKDTIDELNSRNLNVDLKGLSLEESKRSLDDTLIYGDLTLDDLREAENDMNEEDNLSR